MATEGVGLKSNPIYALKTHGFYTLSSLPLQVLCPTPASLPTLDRLPPFKIQGGRKTHFNQHIPECPGQGLWFLNVGFGLQSG